MKFRFALCLAALMLAVLGCGKKSASNAVPLPPVVKSAAAPEDKKDKWPKSVKEAVDRILAGMSEKDRKMVRETAEDDLIKFHHGWGTGIRNDFGLWQGNKDLMSDAKAREPDEASMVIIKAVWQRLRAENVESGKVKTGSLAPAAALNAQIDEFNANRIRQMGVSPIDKRVSRVDYDGKADALKCFDDKNDGFLTLKRQSDGQFVGTLKVKFHEPAEGDQWRWGHVIATFTLPGDQFPRSEKLGDKPVPEAGDFQKADAEKAKAALVDYVRANPEAFIGKPDPDKLAAIPLTVRGDGCFSFGAFEVYVDKKAWSAWAGRDGPEPYLYEGKFAVDQSGRWRAEPPKLSRFRR